MKYIVVGLLAVAVAGVGYVSFFGGKGAAPDSSLEQASMPESRNTRSTNAAPSFDVSKCALQTNGAYICAPESLGDFGPHTITDTATGNTCVISYDSAKGFSFQGPTQSADIPAGPMAVSANPEGSLISLAIQGKQTLTLFTGGGPISSAMLVGQGIDRCTSTASWN